MISAEVFRAGLHALASAFGAQLSASTEAVWKQATRELSDEQWRWGVDATLRSWTYARLPPPAVVIEAGFTMPAPKRDISAVIRPSGEFWESEGQRAYVEQVVRDNPKRQGEGPLSYIRRIAILSGLTADDSKGVL